MIVGRSFVWMHFPKTGGHAVSAAIREAAAGRQDVAFDDEGRDGHRWHQSVAERVSCDPRFDPHGKVLISGIRRLPWWILSRVHYEAARPPHRFASREMICRGAYFEQDGSVSHADVHLARLGDHPVDRWIRLEHVGDDFVRCFEEILGPRARKAARKLRKIVNPTALDYVKSLPFHFTAEELDGLYAANPRWADIEKRVYGDILRL